MALSLTMGSDGLTFNDPGNRRNMGKPFFFRAAKTDSVTVESSWVTGLETGNFNIPKRSELIAHYHYPVRNNSYSWGGGYTRMYYSVNDSAYILCGNLGYCRGAMGSGKYMISGSDFQHAFDFSGMTSDFTIKFRYDHVVHDGTAYIGGDHGLSAAENSTYHGSGTPWQQYLTIQGWTYS